MELRSRPVLAGLPRTGDVAAGPARRERSSKAGPVLVDPVDDQVRLYPPMIAPRGRWS